MFQLYVERKSWKTSLEIIFDLFYAPHTSQDDVWDQRSIFICPQVHWFNFPIIDWGNFLERFMLVKPVTSEAPSTLCLSLDTVGCAHSCKSVF